MEVAIESLRERDNAFCYETVSSPINTKKQPILIILFLVEQEGEATSFLDKIGQFLCVQPREFMRIRRINRDFFVFYLRL